MWPCGAQVPERWSPGDSIKIEVPADFVPGSHAKTVAWAPPDGVQLGKWVRVKVELEVTPPPPAPAPPQSLGGKVPKASVMREVVEREAREAEVVYLHHPNPYNPRIAYPVRACLSFENLRPGFFRLRGNEGLFRQLFGFDSWWDAQKYFDAVKFYQVNVLGEKPEVKLNSILSPFMQYLATLWLLRRRKDLHELAAFFGVSKQRMSDYTRKWIKRLGAFSKANLVTHPEHPEDWQSIVDQAPQAFIDCGLQQVVAIGDCTDILTMEPKKGICQRNQLRSEKSAHSVAMGLSWVTPTGYIVCCTDLFTGRTSENEACKACLCVLNEIPSQFALMYDKGVNKLRPLLANLNQVIIPCFLRKIKRFS